MDIGINLRVIKRKVLTTSGIVMIGVGLYLVYKGTEYGDDPTILKDIIDAEFEIIEEG